MLKKIDKYNYLDASRSEAMDHGPTMSMALNYQVLRLSYHGPRTKLS
jgi:hypothetical protein